VLVSRRPVLAVLVGAAALVAACGEGERTLTAPERVPVELVPDRLLDGTLGAFENRDPSTLETFANTGATTLVADTRVWEIRRGDRLVATLQISTVQPKVDLLDEDVRERFADQLILGQSSRFRSGDVEVFTTTVNDKTIFLWFASNLYEVMQTKDRALEPEELLADLLEHQQDNDGWKPLPELVDFE
jgi:hypothetical protein